MPRQHQTSTSVFLNRITTIVQDCSRQLEHAEPLSGNMRERILSVKRRLESLLSNILDASGNMLTLVEATSLASTVQKMIDHSQTLLTRDGGEVPSYTAEREEEGTRGAPKYNITKEQLQFFQKCGFSNTEMADILHVSARTIARRLSEFSLPKSSVYADLDDNHLDQRINEVIRGNQNIGPNAVRARLRGQGVLIQRHRVRESLSRIDPEGCILRSVSTNRLQRRTYSVAAPLSLWHADGNHKLIKWRIVIHGCVDGYSRLIVFLRASDNNRAETVLQSFTDAVALYGMPSRIRVDDGGENNLLCQVMEDIRGLGRGSAIRGTSVHNQRVERSWVDLWAGVSNLYYDLFKYMEHTGILNPDDAEDLWALHYVFVPRINRDLELYRGQWNNHELRTEKHQTPLKLYVSGVLHNFHSQHVAIQDISMASQVPPANTLGEPMAELHRNFRVILPTTACPLSEERLEQLETIISPLDDSRDMFGVSLFQDVLRFVKTNTV